MLRLSSWGRVGLVAPGPEGSRSQTGVEPMSPALEDRLNHWMTRKASINSFLNTSFPTSLCLGHWDLLPIVRWSHWRICPLLLKPCFSRKQKHCFILHSTLDCFVKLSFWGEVDDKGEEEEREKEAGKDRFRGRQHSHVCNPGACSSQSAVGEGAYPFSWIWFQE